MYPEPLIGAFAKVEWAKAEVNKLNDRVNALLEARNNMLSANVDDQGVEVRRLAAPEIPLSFQIEIGNIIQNLRAPLDKALSAIALQSHPSPKGVQFPFGDNRNHFENALANQDKLPADARDIIRRSRPYKTANLILWAINDLSIPEKHHPPLVAVNVGAVVDLETVMVHAGQVFTVGPRTGRHMFPDMYGNLRQPDPSKQPVMRLGGGDRIQIGKGITPDPNGLTVSVFYNQMGPGTVPDDLVELNVPNFSGAPDDELEVLTCTPGAHIEMDIKPSFNIAFGGIEGLEREPITAVLHQAVDTVEGLLLAFRDRFF